MPKRSMKQDDPLEDFTRRDITLDDVIEILNGLATKLMILSDRIEKIYLLVGGDDEEADS